MAVPQAHQRSKRGVSASTCWWKPLHIFHPVVQQRREAPHQRLRQHLKSLELAREVTGSFQSIEFVDMLVLEQIWHVDSVWWRRNQRAYLEPQQHSEGAAVWAEVKRANLGYSLVKRPVIGCCQRQWHIFMELRYAQSRTKKMGRPQQRHRKHQMGSKRSSPGELSRERFLGLHMVSEVQAAHS